MLIRIANREDPDQTASGFKFSDNKLIIRAGIHKMLIRIANTEDTDQNASEEAF